MKYSILVKNRQGATDGVVVNSKAAVVAYKNSWSDLANISIVVTCEYGSVVGEKPFGKTNFKW